MVVFDRGDQIFKKVDVPKEHGALDLSVEERRDSAGSRRCGGRSQRRSRRSASHRRAGRRRLARSLLGNSRRSAARPRQDGRRRCRSPSPRGSKQRKRAMGPRRRSQRPRQSSRETRPLRPAWRRSSQTIPPIPFAPRPSSRSRPSEPPARTTFIAASVKADSPDDILRRAGLHAFGLLGDDRSVPILLAWSAAGKPLRCPPGGDRRHGGARQEAISRSPKRSSPIFRTRASTSASRPFSLSARAATRTPSLPRKYAEEWPAHAGRRAIYRGIARRPEVWTAR